MPNGDAIPLKPGETFGQPNNSHLLQEGETLGSTDGSHLLQSGETLGPPQKGPEQSYTLSDLGTPHSIAPEEGIASRFFDRPATPLPPRMSIGEKAVHSVDQVFQTAKDYYTPPSGSSAIERLPEGFMRGVIGLAQFPVQAIEAGAMPAQTPEEAVVQASSGGSPVGLMAKRLGYDPQAQMAEVAKQRAEQGRTSESMAYSAAAGIPIFGPIAASAGETAGKGDVAGAIGETAALFTVPELIRGARAELARTPFDEFRGRPLQETPSVDLGTIRTGGGFKESGVNVDIRQREFPFSKTSVAPEPAIQGPSEPIDVRSSATEAAGDVKTTALARIPKPEIEDTRIPQRLGQPVQATLAGNQATMREATPEPIVGQQLGLSPSDQWRIDLKNIWHATDDQSNMFMRFMQRRAEMHDMSLDGWLNQWKFQVNVEPEHEIATRRAQIRFNMQEHSALITAFQNANPDFSTIWHEFGHVLRRDLTPDELNHAEKVFNIDPSQNHKWNVNQEEAFARAHDRWLVYGESPTPEMNGVFQKVSKFLSDTYHDWRSRFDGRGVGTRVGEDAQGNAIFKNPLDMDKFAGSDAFFDRMYRKTHEVNEAANVPRGELTPAFADEVKEEDRPSAYPTSDVSGNVASAIKKMVDNDINLKNASTPEQAEAYRNLKSYSKDPVTGAVSYGPLADKFVRAVKQNFDGMYTRDLPALVDGLRAKAKSFADLAHQISSHVTQDVALETKRPIAGGEESVTDMLKDLLRPGGPVHTGIVSEAGERGLVAEFTNVGPGVRSIISESRGFLPRQSWDSFEPFDGEKAPQNISALMTLREKTKISLQNSLAELGQLQKDLVVAKDFADTTGNQEKVSEVSDRIESSINKFKDLTGRLDAIENVSGRYPTQRQYGRTETMPARDAQGNLRQPGPLETVTIKMAEEYMGRKMNKIPTPEELQERAYELGQTAKYYQKVSDLAKGALDRRNATGQALPDELVEEKKNFGLKPKDFTGEGLSARAKRAGEMDMTVFKTDYAKTPYRGWLTKDGHAVSLDKSSLMHDSAAHVFYPELSHLGYEETLDAMFKNGMIRKSIPCVYQCGTPSADILSTIENDIWNNKMHGHNVQIEFADPNRGGRVRSIWVDEGWDQLKPSFQRAYREALRNESTDAQRRSAMGDPLYEELKKGDEKKPLDDLIKKANSQNLYSADPNLLSLDAIRHSMNMTKDVVRASGLTPEEWFNGKGQSDDGITPRMKSQLLTQQKDLSAVERSKSIRWAQIPGRFWQMLDPFAKVTDRPNPLQQLTMSWDEEGLAIRKGGDVGLYATLRTAVSGIRGSVSVSRQMYRSIENDALSAGLHNQVTALLNLDGGLLAHQVLREHFDDLKGQVESLTKSLDLASDFREQLKIQDSIKDATSKMKDIAEKVSSGKAAPGGMTEDALKQERFQLQQGLGPEKWSQVNDLANRVYAENRKMLDLIADTQNKGKNAVIPQALYEKFAARGDKYIPMQRILSELSENSGTFFGKTSPLWLREQKVVRNMEGSELINIDPWTASAQQHAEVIREFYRNKTLNTFLDAAQKNPLMKEDFHPVNADYKAVRGEKVVGSYQNGVLQRYSVPSWLADSLDTTSLSQAKTVLGMVNRALTGIFKSGATVYNPTWVATRQLPVVAGRALLTAEGPVNPVLIAKAFKDAVVRTWSHDLEWQEAAKTGFLRNSVMGLLYPEDDLSLKDLLYKGQAFTSPKKMAMTLRALSDYATQTLQLNHYMRLRQAGYSAEQAAFQTQHYGPLPDYAQMGKADGWLPAATTFLRADWAHIRSTLALASEPKYAGRLAMAGMAVGLATMAIANHNIQQKDDSGRSLWARIPNTEKEKYWVCLTGGVDTNGRPNKLLIPKPDYVRILFNLMEDAIYHQLDQTMKTNADDRSVRQLFLNAASRFIPANPRFDENAMTSPMRTVGEIGQKTGAALWGQTVPLIRTPIEEGFGQKIGADGRPQPIVSNPKLVEDYQGYGKRGVSPAAMVAGRAMNISPERVEHTAQGMLGPAAGYIERAVNPMVQDQFPRMQGNLPNKQDILRGTQYDQDIMSKTNKFYTQTEPFRQAYSTMEMLKKQDPDQAMQFLMAHQQDVFKGQLASKAEERLAKLKSYENYVQNNRDIDDQTRTKQLENLRDMKLLIFRTFDDMMNAQSGNSLPGRESTVGSTRP
jgi:hypothetical protein